MINKLFVFIFTLFVVGNAYANSPWDPRYTKPQTLNDGFYGGVTLGYNNHVGQLHRTFNFHIFDRVTSVGEKGIATGVFGGYQKIVNGNLYIAAEGFYQYTNILIEKEENTLPAYINYFTSIRNNHKVGVVGKVGYIHCNNVFYLKTGVVLSHFALSFRNQNFLLTPRGLTSTSKNRTGTLIGGGVDYFIKKNYAIGMEYEIISYQPITGLKIDNGGFSFKSTSHTFQLRFKYTL